MPKKTPVRIIDNRKANRATTISGVTLTAPATGVSDHGLLLGLADDDHPQYLLADGTRTLAGNLAVGVGVTVDGVDISAHAANASAHHAPVTAGTLIGLSGQQVSVANGAAYQFIGTGNDTVPEWRNVSELAGNGLTATNGVLAVGVANTGATGLSVEADAVRLTSSSNPGAAASILASDANGYLQLVRIGLGMAPTKPLSVSGDAGISGNVAAGSLSVTGAATVGQDFTVGANVLYVNQAGTRVGINRAPDQQFDLDVAGAIRGQYLIGKHAIQLASAVGVWHYDGPAPYNLDFGGSDASHAGVGGTAAGGVIYRPGKFGKSVQVAPATTNLITNPSFETNTTGWSTAGTGSNTRQTVDGIYGAAYWSMSGTSTYRAYIPATSSFTAISASTAYTASAWMRGTPGATANLRLRWVTTGNVFISESSQSVTLNTTWQRVVLSVQSPATAGGVQVGVAISDGATLDLDAVQLEQAGYATPYCDGSLGAGHSWSGTAHASTSSRTGATLQYANAGGLSVQAGTIQLWVRLDSYNANGGGLFGSGANAEFDAYISAAGDVVFRTDGNAQSAGPVALGAWTQLAFTWDAAANSKKIYLNGVEVASTTYAATATLGSTLYVGSITAGATYSTNGLIDEFVLTDYAMDAKLVRAIYESDAPVFVESSVFHWRSPSASPIWVDEYGLWARSVTGNEILGVYGGDPRRTATYRSWGGVNLEDNDVLIGRAAGGYMHWDDSAQTLSVQGTITALAGSIAGVLTIGTSGEIRQGTGTLGTDYTGLRVWRDSGIGRIGGYASNVLQWYAGTDGVLYAGAGRVILDGTGIAVQASSGTAATAQYAYRILESGANDGFEGGLYAYEGPSNVGQYVQLRAYNPDNPAYISLLAESGTSSISSIELIAKYSTTQARIYLGQGTVEIDGMTYFDSPLTLDEVASTPSNPSSGNRGRIYIRNDNLIIQFNDGGTVRYKYLALSGTGTTWTHSTTAP